MTTYTPPPTAAPWVLSRPTSGTYYIGIGSSKKGADANQYQQTAKQNALADLASDIKINISSNSLLYAFEKNLNLKEDFSSTIKAQTEDQLEGYEMVDNWEDAENYWVYFRLSKAEYLRLKEERKNKAVAIALDFFEKAQSAKNNGELRMSLINLIKSTEPIKPYFSEPLQINFKGNEINLGNEIFNEMNSVLSAINIESLNKQIDIKQGQVIPLGLLDFKVTGANGKPIQNLAVVASYSEKPIRNNKIKTDSKGIAAFQVNAVSSGKGMEIFKVALNLEDISSEATNDFLIRKLFNRLQAPESSVNINIIKPSFFITSNEMNLETPLTPAQIAESLKRKILESGYTFVDKEADADYKIVVNASTKSKAANGSYKQTQLNAIVSVKDKSGAEVYSYIFDSITGSHFDYQTAGLEAYKTAVKRTEASVARELIEGVLKTKSY